MFNNKSSRQKLISVAPLSSHLSAKKGQVRLHSSRNYSLIINILAGLRLNKNLLALFSHREEDEIILKAKITDKRHKTIKRINHVISCGNPYSPDRRKSCPAREVTCNLCRKRGHFAKCCNSSKRRVNLVKENEDVAGPSVDCNFIDVDPG